jgi:hypothetical protein
MNDSRDAAEQPELLEAEWDREKVNTLFDDLQRAEELDHAQIHHVQVRTSASPSSQDCQTTLGEARRLLDAGEARAIQIRYTFDHENWCDTLMVLPDSIRVVRTRDNAAG